MRTRTAVLFVALVAALAGCAGSDPSATPSASPSSSSPSPAPTSPKDLPTSPPATAVQMTLTGQITEGVEHGCRMLTSGGTSYLLLVAANVNRDQIPVGARVTVRGHPEPDMMTTCQQGTPFTVTEVLPG